MSTMGPPQSRVMKAFAIESRLMFMGWMPLVSDRDGDEKLRCVLSKVGGHHLES